MANKPYTKVKLPSGKVVPIYDEVLRTKSKKEIQERMIERGYATEEDFKVDFDAKTAAGNIIPSAKNLAGDVWNAVTNPVETAMDMADVVKGGIQNAADSQIPALFGDDQRDKANAYAKYFKDRFGTWDLFKKSVMEDPVGMAADASTIATPVGGAVKTVTRAGPRAIRSAGNTVAQAGAAIDPVNMAVNTLKAGPRGYNAYTKKPLRLTQNAFDVPEYQAEFLLKRGYPLTKEGFSRFNMERQSLHQEIRSRVIESPDEGMQTYFDYLQDAKSTVNNPNLPGNRRAEASRMINDALEVIGSVDPTLADMIRTVNTMDQIADRFPPALQRAQKASGDLSADMLMPSGVGGTLGMGAANMFGMDPALGGVLGAFSVYSAGAVNKPTTKAALARGMNRWKGPGEGYINNPLMWTILQQQIRTIGSEDMQDKMK